MPKNASLQNSLSDSRNVFIRLEVDQGNRLVNQAFNIVADGTARVHHSPASEGKDGLKEKENKNLKNKEGAYLIYLINRVTTNALLVWSANKNFNAISQQV